MTTSKFLSGNEALAEGVRLAAPHVVAAYPITPQTTVIETLADMKEDGRFKGEFIQMESEHSALSAAMGASSIGARSFTATSSQGLLYMAEVLPYASGGRFPIVMMNANRATALPWNIYGDQRDSISQLDSGWIQVYVEDAQEALDMVLQSYYVAEHEEVSNPVMINLDGFQLTHTYEAVDIPSQESADEYLPKFVTKNRFDYENPRNMGFSVGPKDNLEFQITHHLALEKARGIIKEADYRFKTIFGRCHGGLVDAYRCADAEYVLVSLGSVSGICRSIVDELREEGVRAGFIKLRYLRPFPQEDLTKYLKNAKSLGVLEKDISFGNAGTVYTNVAAEIARSGLRIKSASYVAGLGGRDISLDNIRETFSLIQNENTKLKFIGNKVGL